MFPISLTQLNEIKVITISLYRYKRMHSLTKATLFKYENINIKSVIDTAKMIIENIKHAPVTKGRSIAFSSDTVSIVKSILVFVQEILWRTGL